MRHRGPPCHVLVMLRLPCQQGTHMMLLYLEGEIYLRVILFYMHRVSIITAPSLNACGGRVKDKAVSAGLIVRLEVYEVQSPGKQSSKTLWWKQVRGR